jgi:hypothetical protein
MSSIVFRCQCGKKLQAKGEFAGRKLRCIACTRVLTIPHPFGDVRQTVLVSPRAGSASANGGENPDLIRFLCSCGRKLKAYKQHAGSEVDCPSCGRELKIPLKSVQRPAPVAYDPLPIMAPPTARTVTVPMTGKNPIAPATGKVAQPVPPSPRRTASARSPAPMLADTLTTQSTTPWPSAESRERYGAGTEMPVKSLPWLAIALLLVAGLVGIEWFLAPSVGAKSSIAAARTSNIAKLVPADAVLVATVNAGSLADAKTTRQLDSSLLAYAKSVVADLGFRESDLVRVTAVLLPSEALKMAIGGGPPPPKNKTPGKAEEKPKAVPGLPPSDGTNDPIVIVELRNPIGLADITPHIIGKSNETGEVLAIREGKRVIYYDRNRHRRLFFVDAHTLMVSNTQTLERYFKRRAQMSASGNPFAEALAGAGEHDGMIVCNFTKTSPFASNIAKGTVQSAVITVDEGRKAARELHIEILARFSDPSQADAFKQFHDAEIARQPVPLPAEAYSSEAKGSTLKITFSVSEPNARTVDAIWRDLAQMASTRELKLIDRK